MNTKFTKVYVITLHYLHFGKNVLVQQYTARLPASHTYISHKKMQSPKPSKGVPFQSTQLDICTTSLVCVTLKCTRTMKQQCIFDFDQF